MTIRRGYESHLYVVSESPDGPIKIGRSTNPGYRVLALQTGNPRPLRLVACWQLHRDDASAAERELLDELQKYSLSGEWLGLSEEFILEYMPDFFLSNGFPRQV